MDESHRQMWHEPLYTLFMWRKVYTWIGIG